ncbi:MAG: hypothetical protein QM706_20000 [Nitrospira sp.]
MDTQFAGQMTRGGRVGGDDVQYALAVLLAAARGQGVAEHTFRTVVVQVGVEQEPATVPVGLGGPAGQATGDLLDVALGVAAVHAQRVQFHQLTGVVLVAHAPAVNAVVQIAQHGGRAGRRAEQVAEAAQRMAADRLAVVQDLSAAPDL